MSFVCKHICSSVQKTAVPHQELSWLQEHYAQPHETNVVFQFNDFHIIIVLNHKRLLKYLKFLSLARGIVGKFLFIPQ